jgi:hypothetical protein
MTETLDKQLAKYPGVKEFVDDNKNIWRFCGDDITNGANYINASVFSSISISGLEPKHKNYAIIVKMTGRLIGQKPVYEHVYSYETDTLPDWFKSSTPEKPDNSKRVKKTITRWVNVYGIGARNTWTYSSEEEADKSQLSDRVACVKLTGEYEVDDV